jgi:anti-anti-sigma factor
MLRYERRTAFQADCVRNPDQLILRFSGRLMVHPDGAPPGWKSCLERTPSQTVSLDLGEVTEIDATGLGLLVELARTARSQGRRVTLLAASPRVRKVLSLTRLDTIVDGEVGDSRRKGARIAA